MPEGRPRRWTDGIDAGRNPYREYDACGVGFVAHPRQSSHRVLRLALGGLSRVAHRGATGSDRTGDGAGILTRIPEPLFRRDAAQELWPRAARRRAGWSRTRFLLPAWGRGEVGGDRREGARRRGAAPRGLARRSRAHGTARRLGRDVAPHRPPRAPDGAPGRRRRRVGTAALPRGPRRGAPRASRGARGLLGGVALAPDPGLQGAPDRHGAQGFLPGPRGPRLRDERRRLPPALLHKHAPELGARPAVPPSRAQRRDQHALGKPQRHARARARARLADLGRPHRLASSRSSRTRAATRRASTRRSSSSFARGATRSTRSRC